ncbi:MAG: tetratricopeptide repeat protein [Cyanobacteria bacterium P01_A01_bin.83]
MSHTIGQAKEDNQKSENPRAKSTGRTKSKLRLEAEEANALGSGDISSNSNSSQAPQDLSPSQSNTPESNSLLSDTNYEFLFNQLLEGVAHGWDDHRITKFFKQLGDRGQQVHWVTWLERVYPKLLKLPTQSQRQLGTIMIRLGELTQSATAVNQIGAASDRIGRELVSGNTHSVIWEYDGPDLDVGSVNTDSQTESELEARLPMSFGELSSDTVAATNTAATSTTTELSKEVDSDAPGKLLNADSTIKPLSKSDSTPIELDLPDAESNTNNLKETDSDSEFEFELEKDPSSAINLEQLKSLESAHTELEAESDLNNQTSGLSDTNDMNGSEPIIQTSSIAAQEPNPEAIDMEQVMHLLQEDEELAKQVSAKLNLPLESTPVTEATTHSDTETRPSEYTLKDDALRTTETSGELYDSSIELIESWFNLGLKHASAGEFDKAIASWEKALKINPNLAEAWHNRGSALGRLGSYEAAVESFKSALEIDPQNHQAWNDHAHALYQLQNWTEAVNSWSNAIKIMPGNYLFWYNRGCALEQLEQWQDAIASYEKALEIKPDFQPGRSRYINLVADNSCPN